MTVAQLPLITSVNSVLESLDGKAQSAAASSALAILFGSGGSVVAGIIGCSLVPMPANKMPLRPLYLSIGLVGAAFTLSLLLMPRVPWTYGLAFFGANIRQLP